MEKNDYSWSQNTLLLGIDISSTSVKLLEIVGSKGHIRFESYAANRCSLILSWKRNTADVQLVGEAIGRAVKKSGTRTKAADDRISMSLNVPKDAPFQCAIAAVPCIDTRNVQSEVLVDNDETVGARRGL